MNVFFEESGDFKVGTILSSAGEAHQVELASGKRSKVKAKDVLLQFATPEPLLLLAGAEQIATELDLGLAVVADGMGGYKAGDVASGMAASIMVEELKRGLRASAPESPTQILQDAAKKANQAIFQAAQANPQYHGMGTTLVAAVKAAA